MDTEKALSAIDFFKIRHRMCETYPNCDKCPSQTKNGTCKLYTVHWIEENTQKAVEMVEKWAREHPLKTRKSEFLKMFPNVQVEKDGYSPICPNALDNTWECRKVNCKSCKQNFWDQEI